MVKEISFREYTKYFNRAYRKDIRVRVHCSLPDDNEGSKYFKSDQGISYLRDDGFMGGVCRIAQGEEDVTKLHQEHRVSLGGYFLDCFDTKLVKLYEAQGFGVVGRIEFVAEFANVAWKEVIPDKPDVVFMSLYKKDVKKGNYVKLYMYARSKHNFRLFMSRPQEDKLIKDFHNLKSVLIFTGKTEEDIVKEVELAPGHNILSLTHEMNAYIDVKLLDKFT